MIRGALTFTACLSRWIHVGPESLKLSTPFIYAVHKGTMVDPKLLGRELQVGAVLSGKVRQMQDMLSVQVDLVDANTGAQLWGEQYERKISDVLAVKQTITREVTEKLRLRLSDE